MDFNRKLENLLRDIREIENDAVDVSNAKEISKIEMDLLMEKVRRLYDHLIYIDRHYPYSQGNNRQDIPFEVTGKQATGKNDQQPPSGSKNEEGPGLEKDDPVGTTGKKTSEASREGAKQSPEASQASKASKDQQAEINTTQSEKPEKQAPSHAKAEAATWKGSAEKKTEGPEIVADRYQNSRTFRHDDLAAKQPQNNLSTRMQSRPINDLAKAIGLNDKFLFIKELFEGDKEKYHEAIQIINEMPGFEEAESYINERFDWDEEQPEVKKFMDLVRRKFSAAQ